MEKPQQPLLTQSIQDLKVSCQSKAFLSNRVQRRTNISQRIYGLFEETIVNLASRWAVEQKWNLSGREMGEQIAWQKTGAWFSGTRTARQLESVSPSVTRNWTVTWNEDKITPARKCPFKSLHPVLE